MGRGQTGSPKRFPVQDIHFVLYLQHLSESIQSKSAVEEAVHAVSWLHQMADLSSIVGSSIVLATLGGLRRELAKPKSVRNLLQRRCC